MQTEVTVSDSAVVSTPDERWAAWVARGVEHDRKVRKRAIAAAAFIGTGGALWLAFGLLLA